MAGAIRFITHQPHSPFTILPVVNYSTPEYDLYQHIPQLNSYQTFKPSTVHYAHLQPNSQFIIPTSDLKVQSDNNIMHKFFQRRDERGPNKLNRRDGWGGGGNSHGGPGFGGGGGGVGQSPAISALALLGFLFFLNLIQTSLQNNRQMLTTTTTTTVTTNSSSSNSNSMTSGGTTVVGRNGRVRRKRGFGYEEHRLTPIPIPTHPDRQIELFLHNKEDGPENILGLRSEVLQKRLSVTKNTQRGRTSRPSKNSESHMTPHQQLNKNNRTVSVFQKFKLLSLRCMQLMACTMGRTLFSDIGPGTGFMLRLFGDRFLSEQTKRGLTGRMIRALSDGWKSRQDCSKIYRQCSFANALRPKRKTFRRRVTGRRNTTRNTTLIF